MNRGAVSGQSMLLRLIIEVGRRNVDERLIIVDHGGRLIGVQSGSTTRFIQSTKTEINFFPFSRSRVQGSHWSHFFVRVTTHWDFMSVLVHGSITDRRDGGSSRVSFQQTSSLVSEISHECSFLLIRISSEWVLGIGDSSRSSSSTKESAIVVVIGLRGE
jgi:hypothetical protein